MPWVSPGPDYWAPAARIMIYGRLFADQRSGHRVLWNATAESSYTKTKLIPALALPSAAPALPVGPAESRLGS
jgi:hypothetical protein